MTQPASPLSGMRGGLAHDTWPLEGLGGVTGTGESYPWAGSYCSSGSMGCQPLGCWEMRTVPPASPSFFAGLGRTLSADCLQLAAGGTSKGLSEDPSPKSVVGFDFEAEVAEEQALSSDRKEWLKATNQPSGDPGLAPSSVDHFTTAQTFTTLGNSYHRSAQVPQIPPTR